MTTDLLPRPTETAPHWLGFAPEDLRSTLLDVLRHSPLSRHEQAYRMLLAPGSRPADEAEAEARATTVIRFLIAGGNRL